MSFTENITKSQEFVDKQHQFKYMRLLSMIYVAFLMARSVPGEMRQNLW